MRGRPGSGRASSVGAPASLTARALWSLRQPYRPLYITILVGLFALYILVPVRPFAAPVVGDPAEGGSLGALLLLAIFAVALPALIERRHLVLLLLARNWLVVVTLGWCLLSVLWADYPSLVVRRAGYLIVAFLIVIAITAGASGPRQVSRVLVVAYVAVMTVDLLSVFAVPHLAIEAIGAKGMHTSKNLAGSHALVAVVILVFSILLAAGEGRRLRLGALVLSLLVVLAFLVLTRSKTSLALVMIFLAILLPLVATLSGGRILAVGWLLMIGVGGTGFLFVAGLLGWGRPEILTFLVGDPTFTLRTDVWAFVGQFIREDPVLGTGYGSFWNVGFGNDPLEQARSWLADTAQGIINQAHNGYLDMLLQTGAPGLILSLAVLARGLMVTGVATARARLGGAGWSSHAMAFALLAVLSIYNLMETALFSRVSPVHHVFILMVVLSERWVLVDGARASRGRDVDAA